MHLDGARFMLQRLAASHSPRFKSSFLLTWFLYHEVLACFTQPLRENPQELDLLQLLEGAEGNKTIVSSAKRKYVSRARCTDIPDCRLFGLFNWSDRDHPSSQPHASFDTASERNARKASRPINLTKTYS